MKSAYKSANDRLRIIVLGYTIRCPLGGMVWSNLQFMRGLHCLGHDAYFVEDSDDKPMCYDPFRDTTGVDATYGLHQLAHAHNALTGDDHLGGHDAKTMAKGLKS